MTTALEAVCAFVDANPGGEWQHFQFDALFMREAVREIRDTQHLLRLKTDAKEALRKAYLEQHDANVDLSEESARLAFEIQILQLGQGALKMEIERLRTATPTIRASGAMVAFDANGNVSIKADHVEITGTVRCTGDLVCA